MLDNSLKYFVYATLPISPFDILHTRLDFASSVGGLCFERFEILQTGNGFAQTCILWPSSSVQCLYVTHAGRNITIGRGAVCVDLDSILRMTFNTPSLSLSKLCHTLLVPNSSEMVTVVTQTFSSDGYFRAIISVIPHALGNTMR